VAGPSVLRESAFKHRPTDVVSHPLVIEYKFANRLRQLATLPPALELPYALLLAFWCGRTHGLDCISGRTEFVCCNMGNDCCLTGSVRGMAWCSAEVSGRSHCMTSCHARLVHLDFAAHSSANMLDSPTWSRVIGLHRLKKMKDVLRAQCCPKSEEVMIRIGQSPAATDGYETSVSHFRKDHHLILAGISGPHFGQS
jgi:hypothetical protein